MRTKTKTRLSLIASLGISLVAVAAASISTYAWFQATASATVTTQSSSTTITVAKPDTYSFWAYKGNGNDSYTPQSTESFATDFQEITSGSSLSSVNGLGPGQRMMFAVKVENKKNAVLDIKAFTSNDSSKEGFTVKRKISGTSGGSEKLVNIGWAINIYASYSSDGSGYKTMLTTTSNDKFNYSESSGYSTLAAAGDANHVITSTINLITISDDVTYPYIYLFYVVEFSDHNSTYYNEVKDNTGSSSQVVDATPLTNTTERYFYKNTSGNSNCYGGLTFALNTLELS